MQNSREQARRTVVVGDIHGCLQEFDALLKLLEHRREDRLVLLGDLIDRGPDPLGVVRRAMELNVEMVMGNHCEKMLRWKRNEARTVIDPKFRNLIRVTDERKAEWKSLSEEQVGWLRRAPCTLRLDGGWIAVHAGFLPGAPIGKQAPGDMMRIRHVHRESGKMLSLGEDFKDPPDGVVWTERWKGPESVVYGHFVHGLVDPRVDKPAPGVLCVGLDTGCCFGGRLSSMVLRPGAGPEYVSVPALSQYCKLGGGRF